MFSKSENLAYINIQNLIDSNIKSMFNIFSGTPENMVICYNASNAKKIERQINKKGCTMVNCSENWMGSRKKVRAIDNICVENCDAGYKYLYDSKCYKRCPEDTYSNDYICRKNLTEVEGCDAKKFFLEKCNLTLDTLLEKQKFISQTTKEILNLNLYELLFQASFDKKIFTRKFENESYQIYSLSNKKRVDGISYIDFDNCAEILKEKHRLGKDEDLIIFKIEYKYPDIKIPIIEYQIFDKNGKKKLNLFYCKNVKVLYYIPKKFNNYEDYKYNPEHEYYKEKCFQFDSNFPIDVLILDRKIAFNKNNISLCENLCTFKGYENNYIKCECYVKQKFNSFLND